MALQRLKDAAERAKIELSTVKETQISLPFISTPPGGGGAIHLQHLLTRDKLEALTARLADKTIALTDQVIKEAKIRPADLKEIILVGGMTRMPAIVDRVRKFFKREPCKGVHPEEVVALGAAIQGNSLTTEQSQVLLLDVTPQSLGVAIAGGYFRTLIPKNTTVPTSTSEVFNTSKDYQTTVKIMVLQGESELAHQDELLGEFVLTGLREAKRGEVEIEVTFDINAEGILAVSAKDKETGQQQSITVTASGGLTEDELRRIMEEQRDYMLEAKASDEIKAKRRELEEAKREIEELMPKVRAATNGSEFGSDAVSKAARSIEQATKALSSNNLAAVSEAVDQLNRTINLFKGVIQRMEQ
jgi:molecular chaperone DnaK